MLELATILLPGLVATALFTGKNLAKWNDDFDVVWGWGPYANNSIFDTVGHDVNFVNSLYVLDSGGNDDIEELQTVIFLALCAESKEAFNGRIIERFGPPSHDCTDHIEVDFVVDGCRDYEEGHHTASCKVCGEDLTEQLEETDDREPEHDDEDSGWY